MIDQKSINRNNRKRGSHFEKVGADFLEMDVVPYSGSNARFGYGDVRDSKWLGEFKNITPKNNRICIKHKWIIDNTEKSNIYNLMPFLAWMPAGKSNKYIIIDKNVFDVLKVDYDITINIPKKSKTAVNIFINLNDNWIKLINNNNDHKIANIIFGDVCYFMMNIYTFKFLINSKGLKGEKQKYI